MSNNYKFETMQDMESFFYSQAGEYAINNNALMKADAPVLSTTTGVYNAKYGAQVWINLNTEQNAFAMLPKFPFDRSGWRVETARPAASGGGIAESAAIPDTIKPTWLEVSTKNKLIAHSFNVTEGQEVYAGSNDDAIGDMAFMRARMALHHQEMMNVMLLTDLDTLAGNNLESIDRVTSSYSEVTAGLCTANDSDIYGIDRDAAASWADAVCLHNSGTDRVLTDALILELINTTREAGANPAGQVFLTGYDTLTKIQGIYGASAQYNALGVTTVKLGVNGVETPEGVGVGLQINSLYGIPLILSKNCPKDTISRLYLLDISDPEGYGQPRLGIRIGRPTQYFETGVSTGNPFSAGIFGDEGVFRTIGELICTNFSVQGKLRDLKAA